MSNIPRNNAVGLLNTMPFELIDIIESHMNGIDSIEASYLSKRLHKASTDSSQWRKRIDTELSPDSLARYDKMYPDEQDNKIHLRSFYIQEFDRLKHKIKSLAEVLAAVQYLGSSTLKNTIETLEEYTVKSRVEQKQNYATTRTHYLNLLKTAVDNKIKLLSIPILQNASTDLIDDIISLDDSALGRISYDFMKACTKANHSEYEYDYTDIEQATMLDLNQDRRNLVFKALLKCICPGMEWGETVLILEFLITYAMEIKNEKLCKALICMNSSTPFPNEFSSVVSPDFIEVAQRINAKMHEHYSAYIASFVDDDLERYRIGFKLKILEYCEGSLQYQELLIEHPALIVAGLGMIRWPVEIFMNNKNTPLSSKILMCLPHICFSTVSIIILAVLSPLMLPLFLIMSEIDRIPNTSETAGHLTIHKILSVFSENVEPLNLTWRAVYVLRLGALGMLTGTIIGLAFAVPIVAINIIKHSILSAVDTFYICFGRMPAERTAQQKYLAGGLGYIIAIVPALIASGLYKGCAMINKAFSTTHHSSEQPLDPIITTLPSLQLITPNVSSAPQAKTLQTTPGIGASSRLQPRLI